MIKSSRHMNDTTSLHVSVVKNDEALNVLWKLCSCGTNRITDSYYSICRLCWKLCVGKVHRRWFPRRLCMLRPQKTSILILFLQSISVLFLRKVMQVLKLHKFYKVGSITIMCLYLVYISSRLTDT